MILARRIMSASTASKCIEIVEGKAKITYPDADAVFYNPVQVFNRDLSVAVINHYAERYWDPKRRLKQRVPFWKSASKIHDIVGMAVDETMETDQQKPECVRTDSSSDKSTSGLSILEALSASGLRSIRYAQEVRLAGKIIANDISSSAYESIRRNAEANGVSDKVVATCSDANMLLMKHRSPLAERCDIIDIDPYGSPTMFLDSAVQACHDGGMLCVTCTDVGVLCGRHSNACHAKYGSLSMRTPYCHEMSLRIALACIESHANRHRRYIVPLLSCSIDFYIRIFVLVYTNPQEVEKSPCKLANVYHCNGCGSFNLQHLGRVKKDEKRYCNGTVPPVSDLCEHCGYTFKLGGPIWSDPIYDSDFLSTLVEDVSKTKSHYASGDRMEGLLTVMHEELPDVPLHFATDEMSSKMNCDSPSLLQLRSAIMNLGYRMSISHSLPNAVKTDAPHSVLWDIMRCWVKLKPVMMKNVKPDSPAATLLSKEPKIEASFSIRQDADLKSRLHKLARFPENPPNWGPRSKAKRKFQETSTDSAKKKKP